MVRSLILVLFSFSAFASECDSLFDLRHEGQTRSTEAQNCYQAQSKSGERIVRAHALSRMSYLKFYINEYFNEARTAPLQEGMKLAEDAVTLFGTKYDVAGYLKLPANEKEVLGWAMYNYGLTMSRYVDLAGPLEAIRKMEDIKKSMNTIIRMKEEDVAFFGAHRTLGIFHMKVPAIAGGDIKLSEPYLTKAITSTIAFNGISAFPSNNLALAELHLKQNADSKACAIIASVAALTESDILKLSNGHILESRQTVGKAKELLAKKCR